MAQLEISFMFKSSTASVKRLNRTLRKVHAERSYYGTCSNK